jgi:hypothetical protein
MSDLKSEISNLMSELRSDKKIFENFEIDSCFVEKYQKIAGNSKIFDYWYDKFNEVKNKVDEYDRILEQIKSELQSLFNNCHACFSELLLSLNKFPNYTICHARANIDFLNDQITMMVLFKTVDNKIPEDCIDYYDFQKNIYNIQELFNVKFQPQTFSIRNLHWDDNISIDCITRDFPICIRT